MTDRKLRKLVAILADSSASPTDRAAAIQHASGSDDEEAFDALVRVSTETDVDASVSRAAGEALAQIMIRHGALGGREYELLPWHEWTGEAADAYDDAIARHQMSADPNA